MHRKTLTIMAAHAVGLLGYNMPAQAQSTPTASQAIAAGSRCEGSSLPGEWAPTPSDPYPLNAAGWGPEAGHGLMVSRWAEDWTGMHAGEGLPPLKAIALGGGTSLTLSAEARLRLDTFTHAQAKQGNNYHQGLFRGVMGADLRLDPRVRLYSEFATGQVDTRRSTAAANFQNSLALQQLLLDLREPVGSGIFGAMVGRQEFSDGPRQLISLSDGPNLHRTWNGVRLYAHTPRYRVGYFDLRATQPGTGYLDESLRPDERIQGLTASLIATPGAGPHTYLDAFWIRNDNAHFRDGAASGRDQRDTLGLRLWGRQGQFRYDWTLAYQDGVSIGRDVSAWAVFAVQSLGLSDQGWQPRLTAHVDIASGGNTGAGGTHGFNQLYASSSYLGEGRFLSLTNLALVAPGMSFSPTAATKLSFEYGIARRLTADDAAYAGGMQAYAGTQGLPGHDVGRLSRIVASWSPHENLTLFANVEHLSAGAVLKQANLPSGSYSAVGATVRY
jgi:hypothetical protein